MTEQIDGWTLIDHLAEKGGVLDQLEQDIIKRAVVAVAGANGGLVTIAWVRPMVLDKVRPNRIGAVMSSLVSKRVLVRTGRTAKSDNERGRHGNREVPVYALVGTVTDCGGRVINNG